MRKGAKRRKKFGVGRRWKKMWKSSEPMGRTRFYIPVASPQEKAMEKSVNQLLSTMQLTEMVEASEAIRANQYKMEPLMEVTSAKALKYAAYVDQFEKEPSTRNKANKLIDMLNDRILEVNSKSIDRKEAEKFYKAFMGAGAAH